MLSQIKPQAPLLVVPFRQCLIFMFNVLSLSQEILCIEKVMAANHSPKVLLKMSSRHGLWLRRSRLPLLFRSCSMKTSLANDFAVVRLETKEGTFSYRNISGEEFIFYYGFK